MAGQRGDEDLVSTIEAIMAPLDRQDAPGAAVIVTREGRTLFRQGYGMADLELGVPMAPDMVFRLGSITKQFTAVAILMLAAEGTLALGDPLTRFLPDYPTHGHTVTVEHLLTHTSGIKSYTSMPEWLPLWRKDMALDELIGLFRDQPPEFAPGERFSYSNSGYVLLGAIVERASGLGYAEFLERRIFGPLGMAHSHYDRTERVIPRRLPGYQPGPAGIEHAPYLSMTQPHAAGGLLSSVDDLARWDAALYTDQLLPPALLQRAFTSARLNNGEETGYGYGWGLAAYHGRRIVEHGGGIPGFLSDAKRLPEDGLYVALLMNSTLADPPPDFLTMQIVAAALGRPHQTPAVVPMDAADLERYAGVYADDQGRERTVRRKDGRLLVQWPEGHQRELLPIGPAEFAPKHSFTRVRFETDAAGAVTALAVQDRDGKPERARRTDKPLPARQAIALDPALADRYAGRYAIAPGFVLTIRRDGSRLLAQAGGQEPAEILPETPTSFFFRDVEAQLEFALDAQGTVTGLTLCQAGRDLPACKLG